MENMAHNRQVFSCIHRVIGGTPKVFTYYNAPETAHIDIYSSPDHPFPEVTVYSTIGLSHNSIGMETAGGKPLRVEFVSACESNADFLPNILAECAFRIMNDHCSCRPGTVYPDVIGNYCTDTDLRHIFFTHPSLWEDPLRLETEECLVLWLQAIPISEEEFLYLKEQGADALEDLFEAKNVNIFNIHRKSAV